MKVKANNSPLDPSANFIYSPDDIRALLLQAQKDFNLAPTEMASLLLGRGKTKSYSTYKKWLTSSNNWKRPSNAVLQHLATLYHFFEINEKSVREYIQSQVSNI